MEVEKETATSSESQELRNTESEIKSSDDKHKINIWMIVSIIFVILFSVTASTTVYFYAKSNRATESLQEKIKSEELLTSPTPTLLPTPTPVDYYFNDSTININYYPVQYNTYSKQQQKVAQTFTLGEPITVQTVVFKAGFGVGNNISLDIHKAGNVEDFIDGELVTSGEYKAGNIIKQDTFEIVLDKPVQFETNIEYVLVIAVDDSTTQTSIAFSENDIFSNGKMYKFTRLIGGNGEIISNSHSWQPENSQDILYNFAKL